MGEGGSSKIWGEGGRGKGGRRNGGMGNREAENGEKRKGAQRRGGECSDGRWRAETTSKQNKQQKGRPRSLGTFKAMGYPALLSFKTSSTAHVAPVPAALWSTCPPWLSAADTPQWREISTWSTCDRVLAWSEPATTWSMGVSPGGSPRGSCFQVAAPTSGWNNVIHVLSNWDITIRT